MLIDIGSEHVFEDFLQYIAMSGPLNLRLVAPGRWHTVSKIAQNDASLNNLDLKFLD
jgi:hypothetical protein